MQLDNASSELYNAFDNLARMVDLPKGDMPATMADFEEYTKQNKEELIHRGLSYLEDDEDWEEIG